MEKIMQPIRKYVFLAYIFWLFGGIFGAHHIYLNRDKHAFIWWCTLGGCFGIGWISEIFGIPKMVRDANDDPSFVENFVKKLQKHRKPPFTLSRFIGAFMIGYLWGKVAQQAIPKTVFGGIDWGFLHWTLPFFMALGVWTVGNIGRQKGVFWHCLLASYLVYPIGYYVFYSGYWFSATVFSAVLTFEVFSKQWRKEPPKRDGIVRRTICLSTAITIYLSLWGCYFYFNVKLTDQNGNQITFHEGIKEFLASPYGIAIKQILYNYMTGEKHSDWRKIWRKALEIADVDGEKNAYKTLGVSVTASESEITAAWRKLSKENHPDKVKDDRKQEAHERFVEIQQAYEVLSKIKWNRRMRTKKYFGDL